MELQTRMTPADSSPTLPGADRAGVDPPTARTGGPRPCAEYEQHRAGEAKPQTMTMAVSSPAGWRWGGTSPPTSPRPVLSMLLRAVSAHMTMDGDVASPQLLNRGGLHPPTGQ